MPLQATSGAASYDAFGGGAAAAGPVYIEDVFSTYLWDGNATARNIVNGIDLATKGGMVWTKYRNATNSHRLYDTARGATKQIFSDLTNAEQTAAQSLTSFNADGFSLGTGQPNENTATVVGWTFRKQTKMFDIQTWTGSGANRTISHALGSVPGCIIVKRTDTTANWQVYHRSLANTEYLVLNDTAGKATGTTRWNSTTATSTVFSLGTDTTVNASGGTYVAYIFAHDAGGFGLLGTDNVISCGSYVGDGTTRLINIGYEPQWILIKNADSTDSFSADNWKLIDNMRGFTATGNSAILTPNISDAEFNDNPITIASQGFNTNNFRASGKTYIYIAIRRGPMKVPTTGTSVYNAIARTGTDGGPVSSTGVGFPPDFGLTMSRSAARSHYIEDRLRGALANIDTTATTAENSAIGGYSSFNMDGVTFSGGQASWNKGAETYINHFFKRAPSVFDIVCYTGTGSARTVSHNLAAVPELMIVKWRTGATGEDWYVYAGSQGNTKYLSLNLTASIVSGSSLWNSTTPTSSVFSLGSSASVNNSGATYVAYLFATCAGVSKVFSYTGNGSSQTIDCGFTAGARFVLIKRTDSTGDWYVWDTARGIVAGNDPHLSLNTTAAEVTTDDTIDTDSTGFVVNQVSATNVNVSSATYIGIAVA